MIQFIPKKVLISNRKPFLSQTMPTAPFVTEDILILTKTYPTPSAKYQETTCVAGITREGQMRRLFPVPFRLLEGESQFKRWEWTRIKLSPKNQDRRPESRKIEVDSIIRLGETVDTSDGWSKRLAVIAPHFISDPASLEQRRITSGETFGFIEPTRCIALEITPLKNPDWTQEDMEKLQADGLFDSTEARNRSLLQKLPYDFHYRYECQTPEGIKEYRHKVTDWEFGALYRRCMQNYGSDGWEKAFRDKVEREFFTTKRLLFLLGTMYLYPNRWLIVGVIYPPKPPLPPATQQLDLL